jgi:exopolyphosphatase/guanosine-5'-triphosphate,3'-diphosphate pyrophosphatase
VDQTKRLDEKAISETVSAVAHFADQARSLGAEQIACVATSAARDAENGASFLARVQREAGIAAEIINGDLEAELSYASAARELGTSRPLAVLDIGGGSTELVFGVAGRVEFKRSFDIGSVRLTERLIRHDPPSETEKAEIEQVVDRTFDPAPSPPPGFELVGIAGTVTTLAAVLREIVPYDPMRVHLSRLGLGEVRAERERHFAMTAEARRSLPGMDPKRADVIPAGALILERAMVRLGAAQVTVSDRGIRWGLLYHRFGAALLQGSTRG